MARVPSHLISNEYSAESKGSEGVASIGGTKGSFATIDVVGCQPDFFLRAFLRFGLASSAANGVAVFVPFAADLRGTLDFACFFPMGLWLPSVVCETLARSASIRLITGAVASGAGDATIS